MKERMTIIVEMTADGHYDCYQEDEGTKFCLTGYGNTVQEAMDDLMVATQEIREVYAKDGIIVPEYEFKFKFDIGSFFEYFDFLNVKKVAEMAGINYKLLNHYINGHKKAGRMQYDRLEKALKEISKKFAKVLP